MNNTIALAQLDAFSLVVECGVTANRHEGIFAGKTVKTFVVFVPVIQKKKSDSIHWKGAITWGSGGIIFDAKIANKKNIDPVIYTYERPRFCRVKPMRNDGGVLKVLARDGRRYLCSQGIELLCSRRSCSANSPQLTFANHMHELNAR